MNNETTTEVVAQPTATVETVATPSPIETTTPTGSPQQVERQNIYEKYYGTQAQPQTTTPTIETTTTTTAEPTTQVEPTPAAPMDVKAIVSEVIRSLMPPLAKPAVVEAPPPTPSDPNAWINNLISGDFNNATSTLEKQIIDRVREQLAPEIQKQALTEAVENFKAETELNTFVNSIRTENPDIIKLEPLIAPKIQIQMHEWIQSQGGKVPPLAYVEQYKKVATAEINEARNLIQSFRAAGAGSQQTVKQEVLSSTTLAPSPVSAPQMPTGQPKVQTAQDYLALRQQQTNMRNGMKLRN